MLIAHPFPSSHTPLAEFSVGHILSISNLKHIKLSTLWCLSLGVLRSSLTIRRVLRIISSCWDDVDLGLVSHRNRLSISLFVPPFLFLTEFWYHSTWAYPQRILLPSILTLTNSWSTRHISAFLYLNHHSIRHLVYLTVYFNCSRQTLMSL